VFLLALAVPLPALASAPAASAYVIADFEGPHALQNWRFSGNPAAPAVGSLALGPGHRRHGAVLSYNLPCDPHAECGAFAAALWRPATPLPKRHHPSISLWIRTPLEVEAFLVATDSSGQTLQFPIRAGIEYSDLRDWRYVVIPLSHAPSPDTAGPARASKGRIVEIGVRLQARVSASIQGSVSFDDIELRDASETFHVDPAAETAPPPRAAVRLAPHLGVNIHLTRDNPSLDLAHSAGFAFARMDLLWANVERHGRYRFFGYDGLLRALEARGMGALWILDYGHPDHGGDVPRTPEDIAAFGRFAEAVAAHFKGRNVRYEIWNEPNNAHFWPPVPNPAEYAALLREAVAAIHRGDPLAQISSGGLSRIDEQFLYQSLDPGLAASLAAIGVHPYPKAGPESVAPEVDDLRRLVALAYGDRIEVWDTEWGYPSSNAPRDAPSNGHTAAGRRRQACLAVRELLTVWALGFPVAVWYDLRDDGADPANPEQNYGLLDSAGNEKPALIAVRTLTGAAANRNYAGMVAGAPPGIHAMRLDGAGDTMLIVWTDRPGARVTVDYPTHNLLSAADMLGDPLKSKERPNGQAQVELDEAAGPIYLLWRTEQNQSSSQ
jgi:hypothetical protein